MAGGWWECVIEYVSAPELINPKTHKLNAPEKSIVKCIHKKLFIQIQRSSVCVNKTFTFTWICKTALHRNRVT